MVVVVHHQNSLTVSIRLHHRNLRLRSELSRIKRVLVNRDGSPAAQLHMSAPQQPAWLWSSLGSEPMRMRICFVFVFVIFILYFKKNFSQDLASCRGIMTIIGSRVPGELVLAHDSCVFVTFIFIFIEQIWLQKPHRSVWGFHLYIVILSYCVYISRWDIVLPTFLSMMRRECWWKSDLSRLLKSPSSNSVSWVQLIWCLHVLS